MLLAALIALGLLAGLGWPVTVVAAGAAVHPVAVLVVAALWGLVHAGRRRRRAPRTAELEAAFCVAVASELRGGASLRAALADAATRAPGLALTRPVRAAAAGLPTDELAAALGSALPVSGATAAAAVEIAAATGAGAAGTFDTLAERARHAADLERERRVLTAQARLSAYVVGVGPPAVALALLLTGRGSVLLRHGTAGLALTMVGFGLQLLGMLAVVLLLRRSR